MAYSMVFEAGRMPDPKSFNRAIAETYMTRATVLADRDQAAARAQASIATAA